MVYGAAWTPLSTYKEFGDMGFKGKSSLLVVDILDSKTLKMDKREQLFQDLRSTPDIQIEFKVFVISAQEISEKMQMMYFFQPSCFFFAPSFISFLFYCQLNRLSAFFFTFGLLLLLLLSLFLIC